MTFGMLLLALLGVLTVFHEPIAVLFGSPAASGEPLPSVPADEHAAPPTPAARPR